MLQDLIASDRIAEYRREADQQRLAHAQPPAARAPHRLHFHLPAVLRHPARHFSRTV